MSDELTFRHKSSYLRNSLLLQQTMLARLPSPSEEMDLQGTQIPTGIEVPTFVGSRKLSYSLCYLSLRSNVYSRTSQIISIKVNLGQFSFWRFMSTQFGDWETIEKTISWFLREKTTTTTTKSNKIKHKTNSDKKCSLL